MNYYLNIYKLSVKQLFNYLICNTYEILSN